MTLDNLLSGVIGGMIGGACSVAAVIVQNWLNRRNQAEAENKLVSGVLRAIHNEIDTLWTRYDDTVGKIVAVLLPGQPFIGFYPVYQDYFTVYTGNAFLLGRIRNHELRALIVKTYTIAKGLIDSFRANNEMNLRLENAVILFKQTKQQVFQEQANVIQQQLAQYAGTLKARHGELKDHVERLVRAIDGIA